METEISWRLRLAFLCYGLFVLITGGFALVYLYRSEFLPYHSAILGQAWNDLSPSLRELMLGFMTSAGGGWLAAAVAVAILLYFPFRQGMRWSYWAIPAVGLPPALANLYNVIHLAPIAHGSLPWQAPVSAVVLLLAGLLLSMLPAGREHRGD